MSDNKAFLAAFLAAAHGVHVSGAGTKETSYYTALDSLLDGIGQTLKPKVRCVMQLKSLGAGNPDGGLFTADQFDRKTDAPKNVAAPGRGVLEVKAPGEAVDFTAASAQVAKYWDRYRLVLVTNLRDWLLIGERSGKRIALERYTLADTELAFWALAAHAAKAQQEQGRAFADFLARVMLNAAPLGEPKDLAWLLASYAREAAHRVERATPTAQLQLAMLKQSLESALGVDFDAKDGEHFFRSTLVQTLFYGVFAAWVLRHQGNASGSFDWKTAAYDLNVPMISALFEQLSQPTKLKALDLTVVLDWAADALNRDGLADPQDGRLPGRGARSDRAPPGGAGQRGTGGARAQPARLDTETPVPGVASGTPRPELKSIASVARLDGAPLAAADFPLTAGWGSAGQGGVTMPVKVRVENRIASAAEAASGFGTATHDVYLNAQACWRHVPPAVWNYTLGGYQVLKKWLSYREQALLGRPLTLDEVKAFTANARRIAALLGLRDRLDENYKAVSANTAPFKSTP
jgi:Type ISP C-terminal specificity domain